MRRSAALVVIAGLVVAFALPVLSQEETTTTAVGEGETAVEEGEATVPIEETPPANVRTPAITVVPTDDAEIEQPWTARYLVPTGLLLAAIAVFVTVVQYFLRVVRNRYKVVE